MRIFIGTKFTLQTMKRNTIVIVLFSCLVWCTGCEDILDVEERFTFQHIIIVNTEDTSYDRSNTFDLADHVSVIDEYGSKIKEVKIEKVEYWLSVFQGTEDQRFEGGSLRVSPQGGAISTEVVSLGGHYLHALWNTPHELPLNNAGSKLLGELAADPPHRFDLHAQGSVNEGPLHFTIVFEFTAKMVANPLN